VEERVKETEAKNRLTPLKPAGKRRWKPGPRPGRGRNRAAAAGGDGAWLSTVEGCLIVAKNLKAARRAGHYETAVRSIEPVLSVLALEAGLLELKDLDAAWSPLESRIGYAR